MPSNRHITFFHSPQTRSGAVLLLLEELQADYEVQALNMKIGEQRQPAYLAINPMGKVPAIVHGGTLVTEQVAIFIYLADLYAEAGLAPALADPLRGVYLRWLVFYGSCFEPAIVDRSQQRDPGGQGMSPYGSYDATVNTLHDQLSRGPYILGEKFSAADLLWGTAMAWMVGFKLVENTPVFQAYIDRINARPAAARVAASDAELAARHAAAAST